LLSLTGIGPWTADYLTVRILGDRDAFVPDDLVLKRALGVSSGKEAAALSEKWRPWRAYALFHLWTEEAFL
jgi:AraC family transcriptional regulator of adaptative response / DNA-3-methyladenine glycosylase II